MMDMKFSPEWLLRVAKEEDGVRFSVGGWTAMPDILTAERALEEATCLMYNSHLTFGKSAEWDAFRIAFALEKLTSAMSEASEEVCVCGVHEERHEGGKESLAYRGRKCQQFLSRRAALQGEIKKVKL